MSPAPLLQCFPLTSIPCSFVSIGSKSHRCSGQAGGLRLEVWLLLSWIRNFASSCGTFFIKLFLPRSLPRVLRTELLVRALVTTGCCYMTLGRWLCLCGPQLIILKINYLNLIWSFRDMSLLLLVPVADWANQSCYFLLLTADFIWRFFSRAVRQSVTFGPSNT